MEVKIITTGPFWTNTYLITNNNKSILIDPSLELSNKLDLNTLNIEAILLTHGHIDHIEGIKYLNKPIYIFNLEADFLKDNKLNLALLFNINYQYKEPQEVIKLYDNQEFSLIGLKIKVIHTPGHTRGSVTYQIENNLFTGDTLFQCSKGRTDFYTGDEDMLDKSLIKLIDSFKSDTTIYPGHGERSTIGFEKEYNPFYKQAKLNQM